MPPGPATSSPPCCLSRSVSSARSTHAPWLPAPTLPAGRGTRERSTGPRPVRRLAASPGAGPGPRAPGHSGHPFRTGPPDGGDGGCGRARDQFAALLPIRERIFGPEHPDILGTRGNLAWWTGAAGDAAGARDQVAALLPMHERVLGSEHPYTLETRLRLANWTGVAGDAAGVRDQVAALLPAIERVLGPEHPDTQEARHILTSWTSKAEGTAGSDVD